MEHQGACDAFVDSTTALLIHVPRSLRLPLSYAEAS